MRYEDEEYFDPYFERRMGLKIRDARPRIKRDHAGREYLDQNGQCYDRNTHPYDFSEVIHWMINREKGNMRTPRPKGMTGAEYSDRLSQRDWNRYNQAVRSTGEGRLEHRPREKVSEFLSIYFGRATEALGLVEGCNASSGYPYYIFYFKFLDRDYKANEYTEISVE